MRTFATHGDDVILAEAELVVIVTFEVEQRLRASTSMTRDVDVILEVT